MNISDDTSLGALFDILFGNSYQYPKSVALDDDHKSETVSNMVAEISDMRSTIEHYKAIFLVVISCILIKLIFG